MTTDKKPDDPGIPTILSVYGLDSRTGVVEAERDRLAAEVERLKGEFASYRELKRNKCETHQGARVGCGQCYDSMATYLKNARAEADSLRAALAKAEAFKAYVHKRLDDAGVPADPEPAENAKHGCRVEGRLNYLEASIHVLDDKRVKAEAEGAALRGALGALLKDVEETCGRDCGGNAENQQETARAALASNTGTELLAAVKLAHEALTFATTMTVQNDPARSRLETASLALARWVGPT